MSSTQPKINKESTKEPFRNNFTLDAVARLKLDNDTYEYKLVIYNYKKNPTLVRNVEEHEKEGYEVVYTTEHIEDDRKFVPTKGNDEESLRPRPVLKVTTDGFEQVLMRRLKTVAKARTEAKIKEEQEKYRRSQRSVKQDGSNINIDGGELNLDKPLGE